MVMNGHEMNTQAFEQLQTPVLIYALRPLRLLWANSSSRLWLACQGLNQLSESTSEVPHNPALITLQRYRDAVARGEIIGETWTLTTEGPSLSIYCIGSAIDLGDGETGLLLEGHWLRGTTTQQAMLEALPDLTLRMNREGQCLDVVSNGEVVVWHNGLQPGQSFSIYEVLPLKLAEQRIYHVHQAILTGRRQIYRQEIEIAGQLRYEEVRIVKMGAEEALVMVRDITQMVLAENSLLEQAKLFEQQSKRDRLIAQVTQRISQSLDLQEILDTTVQELRRLVDSQRVLVYRFDGADGSGRVIAEALAKGWPSLLNQAIEDRCFAVDSAAMQGYLRGRIQRTNDIQMANLSRCYVRLLSGLQVQANLVIPILQGDYLWGLLTCQQCDGPRNWSDLEVDTLAQLANQLAIAIQKSELYEQLQRANQELQHLATHDKLTKLPNRRYFDDYLEQEWRRLTREQAPLSLILCDIDYFKSYNDSYGHLAGDHCLAQVAHAIARSINRPADLAARYGGEEFAVILPNTDLAGAIRTGELIQESVAQAQIPHPQSPVKRFITLSMGIACLIPTLDMPLYQLTDLADQALYQAKENGRDRYCVAQAARSTLAPPEALAEPLPQLSHLWDGQHRGS